ncbi:hypothetical protein SASPL_147970 [Salvia splendens]|uniref:Uncharacterized protein n=1 Tax=Salvia splendens TaxID=180675 RepID=A0A8X8Z3N4_SALSN|nr:hypothetical protein SASPL_147970 [Salvia splendens]
MSPPLQRLYNLGARKFVIAGLGLLGCIPSIQAQSRNGVCSKEVNQLIVPFNTNTKVMINNLICNLPGIQFSYIDIHNMFQDLLANARSYGRFQRGEPRVLWNWEEQRPDKLFADADAVP